MSNEELYRDFLAGDNDAFTQLMERFGDSLTFYIYGYTKNLHDAEDLMIDVFSYLVAKRPKIGENGLKAYLYKAARHKALRSIERKNKYFSIELEEASHLSDERNLVDGLIHNKETYETLHMAMEELAPQYREALYLVYFEGLSHKEAALVMKKREKQLSDLVFRGKKALKVKLEKEGITNA